MVSGTELLYLIFEPDKLATQLNREALYPMFILKYQVLRLYFFRDSNPQNFILVDYNNLKNSYTCYKFTAFHPGEFHIHRIKLHGDRGEKMFDKKN